MISVARNTHIPSSAAACCWLLSSNCVALRAPAAASLFIGRPTKQTDFRRRVVVWPSFHDRRLLEILGWRWRARLPFQSFGIPRIRGRTCTVEHRPQQITKRQQVSSRQNRGAGRREHIQHLELRSVLMIAARHAFDAEQILRKEGEIEAEENQD